ncbi:hypothetical protein VTJ04DRAFT_315 [Mycothermus thermophilus]|uniref:uncharacterized protein n=1 Tax=Humicola insolens TaxID=85995 RepID=UPI0037444B50
MRPLKPSRGLLWLLALSCCVEQVAAAAVTRIPRQEEQITTTIARIDDIVTSTTDIPSPTPPADEKQPTRTTTASTIKPSSSSSTSVSNPAPTTELDDIITTNELIVPIPVGQLPLEPRLSPSNILVGTLLLPTGLIYTFLSPHQQLHPVQHRLRSFLSVAYSTSLGVAILVLYLTVPPVPPGLQAGYVMTAAAAGAVLGGAALLLSLTEVAELAGCGLGGFVVGMWLLTVKEGGLVPSVAGRAGMLVTLTVLAAGLYVVRKIRMYVLAGCGGWVGGTVTVLGIDCFARAGWKEFWVWLWMLNEGLFAKEVEEGWKYPLTKGMTVELAATVVLAVAGAAGQLRLWRKCRERRGKGEEDMDERRRRESRGEDEVSMVGRRVVEEMERERREWERVYGEGMSPAAATSADSGIGGIGEKEKKVGEEIGEKEKKAGEDSAGTVVVTEAAAAELEGQPMPLASESGLGTVKDGVMVEAKETETEVGREGEDARPSNEPPQVIPLPFLVPVPSQKRNSGSGSSVAVAIDDEAMEASAIHDDNADAAAWLSEKLLKSDPSVSGVSGTSGVPYADSETDKFGPLSSQARALRDDSDSVVANLDDESVTEDADTAILFWSPGLSAQNVGKGSDEAKVSTEDIPPLDDKDDESKDTELASSKQDKSTDASQTPKVETASTASSAGEEPNETKEKEEKDTSNDQTTTDDTTPSTSPEISQPEEPQPETAPPTSEEQPTSNTNQTPSPSTPPSRAPSATAKSTTSSTATARLTKTNLPPPLPDVALVYRTNEWAKHLSLAEAPADPSALAPEVITPDGGDDEQPAHLDIADLQLTAENATPPPIPPKAAKRLSSTSGSSRPGSMMTATPQRYTVLESIPAEDNNGFIPVVNDRRSLACPVPSEQHHTHHHPQPQQQQQQQFLHPHPHPHPHRLSTTSISSLALRSPSSPLPSPSAAAAAAAADSSLFFPHHQHQPKPAAPTLLSMREQILRTRASAIHGTTPLGGVSSNSAAAQRQSPLVQAQGGGGGAMTMMNNNRRFSSSSAYPLASSSTATAAAAAAPPEGGAGRGGDDWDDLPLSQRRALIMRQSRQSMAPGPGLVPAQPQQQQGLVPLPLALNPRRR